MVSLHYHLKKSGRRHGNGFKIRLAVLYFIIGIGLGLFMSATIQLYWAAAHAPLTLLVGLQRQLSDLFILLIHKQEDIH